MRKIICLFFFACVLHTSYAQTALEYGASFDFDPKTEQDPQFVLADNYNHYLLTVIITDGLTARRQAIVRKFDHKNQLLDKLVYDFPKFDISTLFNYIGFSESKNGSFAVFTQTYSGKAKKSVIFKHVYDKASGKFTSTEIATVPIASAMKSGTVMMMKSENERYIGINHTMHRQKEEAEKNQMLMLDANTYDIVWQKEFAFSDDHATSTFTITNSGKAVYLRTGKKKHNYMVLASADGQEDKTLETEIVLQQPKAISIGTQDYILAFNYPAKGVVRMGDFSDLLLYDLQSGRTIQNVDAGDIGGAKNIKEAQISNVTIENNEIRFFAEAKAEADMKTVSTVGGMGSAFPETEYIYGPAYLYVLGTDGTKKTIKRLTGDGNPGNIYRSFGLVDIKGIYYINTGRQGGFFPLIAEIGYAAGPAIDLHYYPSEPKRDGNVRYVNQLAHYFPDSKRLLLARVISGKELALVNITGVQ